MHFPAPKVALPGHAESYNPPAEYLFDDEELKKWEVSSSKIYMLCCFRIIFIDCLFLPFLDGTVLSQFLV